MQQDVERLKREAGRLGFELVAKPEVPPEPEVMGEEEAWALVAELEWKKDHNDHRIKKTLMKRFTLEEADHFSRRLSRYMNALYLRLDEWSDEQDLAFGLGDDSFGDLIADIVGRGREFYESVMAKPSVALELARAYDFGENFMYGIPSKGCYESLDPAEYDMWAKGLIAEYTGDLEMTIENLRWHYPDKGEDELRECAERNIQAPRWGRAMLPEGEDRTFLVDALNKVLEHDYAEFKERLPRCEEILSRFKKNIWAMRNLNTDIQRYLVNF